LKSLERAHELDEDRLKKLLPEVADVLALSTVVLPSATARMATIVAAAEAPARTALGKALKASTDGAATDTALKSFDQAAAAAPRCPVVARERARFLVSRFRIKAARDAIANARSVGAPEADMLLLEALLAVRSLSLDVAREAAEKLATLAPDDIRTQIAGAYLAAADRRDDAVSLAKKAVATAPGEPLAHLALAEAWYGVGKSDSCIDEARTALALGARLDEECELMLLRALSLSLEPRELMRMMRGGGRMWGGRGDHHDDHPDSGVVPRLMKLDTEQHSARISYIIGITALNLIGRIDRQEMAQGAFSYAIMSFTDAAKDEDCPLGYAGLGYSMTFIREPDPEKLRAEWSKARKVDPRWRLPAHWVKRIAESIDGGARLAEEFSKAPR
jgi:Tfp pilus assembly protein PilF